MAAEIAVGNIVYITVKIYIFIKVQNNALLYSFANIALTS